MTTTTTIIMVMAIIIIVGVVVVTTMMPRIGAVTIMLLIRRNRQKPEQRAYYFVFARKGTSLAELAGAAGLRWTIEECFQRAKMISASTIVRRDPGTGGTGI